VHRAGHGVALSLPRWAVDHLGIVPGQHVHVTLGPDGSVVLDNPRALSHDGAERLAAAETISALRAGILTLRRKLRGAWLNGYGAGVCYGWHRAFGESLSPNHAPPPAPPSDSRRGELRRRGGLPPGRPENN
jgi:antitoxin component of MazEF toxin-antitoxin module